MLFATPRLKNPLPLKASLGMPSSMATSTVHGN